MCRIQSLLFALAACIGGAVAGAAGGPRFPAIFDLSTLNGDNGFRLDGALYEQSGVSVAAAGDVNGDGLDDLVIGSPSGSLDGPPAGAEALGVAYVVFGRPPGALAFPSNAPLSSLDGTNGFRLEGVGEGNRLGYSVTGAGDINGDGLDDMILAARTLPASAGPDSASVYIVFGRDQSKFGAFPATMSLRDLDGSNGFRLGGLHVVTDRHAESVSYAADVNGDNLSDVIVGVPRADPNGFTDAGSAFVIFGRDTSATGAFPATFLLASVNGTSGFRINGASPHGRLGASVACAGDLNADGISDLVIGAPAANSNAGACYVVFGRNAESPVGPFPAALSVDLINGQNGLRLDGSDEDKAGSSVASAGDINADNVDDLIIGAPSFAPAGKLPTGAAFVVFGRDANLAGEFPAVLALSSLDGAIGFRIDGVDPFDQTGCSVANLGDVTGDGAHDIAIGALSSGDAGSVFVVFGREAAFAGGFPAALPASTLNGENGFRAIGISPGDTTGYSVAGAGDINSDGAGDLLLSAINAQPEGLYGAGSSYIIFGTRSSCDGDTNADGVVDFIDLNSVLSSFGAAQGQPAYQPGADLNRDHVVDFLDLNIVLSHFGASC